MVPSPATELTNAVASSAADKAEARRVRRTAYLSAAGLGSLIGGIGGALAGALLGFAVIGGGINLVAPWLFPVFGFGGNFLLGAVLGAGLGILAGLASGATWGWLAAVGGRLGGFVSSRNSTGARQAWVGAAVVSLPVALLGGGAYFVLHGFVASLYRPPPATTASAPFEGLDMNSVPFGDFPEGEELRPPSPDRRPAPRPVSAQTVPSTALTPDSFAHFVLSPLAIVMIAAALIALPCGAIGGATAAPMDPRT